MCYNFKSWDNSFVTWVMTCRKSGVIESFSESACDKNTVLSKPSHVAEDTKMAQESITKSLWDF